MIKRCTKFGILLPEIWDSHIGGRCGTHWYIFILTPKQLFRALLVVFITIPLYGYGAIWCYMVLFEFHQIRL